MFYKLNQKYIQTDGLLIKLLRDATNVYALEKDTHKFAIAFHEHIYKTTVSTHLFSIMKPHDQIKSTTVWINKTKIKTSNMSIYIFLIRIQTESNIT